MNKEDLVKNAVGHTNLFSINWESRPKFLMSFGIVLIVFSMFLTLGTTWFLVTRFYIPQTPTTLDISKLGIVVSFLWYSQWMSLIAMAFGSCLILSGYFMWKKEQVGYLFWK